MTDAATADVSRTIEYRADRWLVGWLPYTLLLAALGLFMVVSETGRHRFGGWVVLLIAAAFSLFFIYRLISPGPSRLTLSPAGLGMYVGRRHILIPWREIQSVDTTDLKVRNWGRGALIFPFITFKDCTMVKVSRPFYEESIHVPSVFMQGPGWQGIFTADGNSMRIAVHHEQFAVTAQQVRAPIEARWRAFRGRSHPASRAEENAAEGVPRRTAFVLAEPIRYGNAELLTSFWDAIKLGVAIAVFLAVASNALGVWETEDQEERRLERTARAEEARKEKEERDRQKKKWDDFWRDFDRSFDRR
jgi:hypothetical protein